MTGIRFSPSGVGRELFRRELVRCGAERVTGALHVLGRPGGVFHLRQGSVVAAQSPGAPGVGALLLRSGRVDEPVWTEVHRAGPVTWSPGAELVAAGCLGATELQVVCVMAMKDATFAMLAGSVEDCVTGQPGDAVLEAGRGEDPAALLREADRRLGALDSLPKPVLPDAGRFVRVEGDRPDEERLPAARREILHHANGRRTARDVAFLTGRGVYAVTVEISRMLAEGLLRLCSDGEEGPAVQAPGPVLPRGVRAAPPDGTADSGLPWRQPGCSGIIEALAAQRQAAS